jgi:hypothetical protein
VIGVYLEVTKRRTFAGALDWPGWTRPGKTPEAALETLADYRARYATVLKAAKIRPPGPQPFDLAETLEGDATTEFGAPGRHPSADSVPLSTAEAKHLIRIWRACWEALDRAGQAAPPTLAKGPRGGGRDRDAILAHVVGADQAYARMVRLKSSSLLNAAFDRGPEAIHRPEVAAEVEALHQGMIEAVMAGAVGEGPDYRWPARYLVRRSAWHALDHAWEIEDKS